MKSPLILLYALLLCVESKEIVVTTWNFTESTQSAWNNLMVGGSAVDAVEIGCRVCEELQCHGSVGFGHHPDENGETTLDAMIMDGDNFNVGAVAGLRRIKNAVGVARKVLDNTLHSMLSGDLETDFAVQMGFMEENLSSAESTDIYNEWKSANCQPNFWMNVMPNSSTSCGPYSPLKTQSAGTKPAPEFGGILNHDTIGMIAIDKNGKIAVGTSTNGAQHKIPGRVGDSPIPGAGAYVDGEIGAAVATGNGDIMLRFLPTFAAVDFLRQGYPPQSAAKMAVNRIKAAEPTFSGAVIVVSAYGEVGAACNGLDEDGGFQYMTAENGTVTETQMLCEEAPEQNEAAIHHQSIFIFIVGMMNIAIN